MESYDNYLAGEPIELELATDVEAPKEQDGRSVLDRHLNNVEKKQLLGGDFANLLEEWNKKHGSEVFDATPCAQTWDGRLIGGASFIPTNLLMKYNRDWVDVFVSDDDITQLGLKAYPEIRPVYFVDREISSGEVIFTPYWNISDTNAHKVMPELFRKIQSRFDERSRNLDFCGKGTNESLLTRTQCKESCINNIIRKRSQLVNSSGRRAALDEIFEFFTNSIFGKTSRSNIPLGPAGQFGDSENMYEFMREVGKAIDNVFKTYPGLQPKTVPVSQIQHELAREKEELAAAREQAQSQTPSNNPGQGRGV